MTDARQIPWTYLHPAQRPLAVRANPRGGVVVIVPPPANDRICCRRHVNELLRQPDLAVPR